MKKLVFLFLLLGFASSFNKKEITWVAIGDSITYLNDHPNETGNRITKGYMTRVTQRLSHIHFINQGYNGWTSGRIADSIENLGLIKADVYSVFLGTNDWWQGRSLGLLNLNNKAKIILITPMQRSDFIYINNPENNAYGSYKEKNGQWLEQFAHAIDSIGQYEHIKLVDLYHKKSMSQKNLIRYKRLKDPQAKNYKNYPYPDFISIPFNPATDEYPYPVDAIDITYDGLHPSDKGYDIIARMLIRVMKKY
jgi:lysophospholipase L1-like esterase